MFDTITLLTDFGLEDDFVGVCKGVIARIAPQTRVIDLTHGIAPQAVLQGSLVLARTLPYIPAGVHVAVVDPGVGSTRRAIAVSTLDNRVLVGPDNGLLIKAAELAGVSGAVELTNERYHLAPVSRTFHARDIFSPVAAHLAGGVPLFELGDAVPPESLVRCDPPTPTHHNGTLHATVLDVDRFGNLGLNISRADLAAAGIADDHATLRAGAISDRVPIGTTFADVAAGELILLEDSYGAIAVAVNGGSAREHTGCGPGTTVHLSPIS
ncbi:MAG: hypothetical protein F2663_00370 [Actinobacteria bacterium]|uniref:Unannotated protein n=1 Tax=freshwater metagenome TaxID=449393 RepID=A0A6J6N8U4_9ZZZZ|nr:hypothetical protein [Actinomycetota bacterium]